MGAAGGGEVGNKEEGKKKKRGACVCNIAAEEEAREGNRFEGMISCCTKNEYLYYYVHLNYLTAKGKFTLAKIDHNGN
jgi:hypothetical protein